MLKVSSVNFDILQIFGSKGLKYQMLVGFASLVGLEKIFMSIFRGWRYLKKGEAGYYIDKPPPLRLGPDK